MIYLGIEINRREQTIALPQEEINELTAITIMVNTQKMYTKGTVIINRKTGICIQGDQTRQNIPTQTYINSLLSGTTTPLHISQQRSPKKT